MSKLIDKIKDCIGQELENALKYHAFESYDLMRGRVAFTKFRKRKSTNRKI